MDGFRGSEMGWSLDLLAALGLLSSCERAGVNRALGQEVLAPCLLHADTIHLHIKVDDTERLPRAALEAAGGMLDHAKSGFVKYRMPAKLNAIFSHIAVSAEDLQERSANRRPRPLLDHVGIDVRTNDAASRRAFSLLPSTAASLGWAHVAQGGAGSPVRCCHVAVDGKLWLFPTWAGARPIEIALGPLRDLAGAAGCDLRPAHPATDSRSPSCPS